MPKRRRRTDLKVVALPVKPPPETPWSPLEMLLQFAKDLEAGKIKLANLMVFYMEVGENGSLRPNLWTANVTSAEQVAYCELGKQAAIDYWRNG